MAKPRDPVDCFLSLVVRVARLQRNADRGAAAPMTTDTAAAVAFVDGAKPKRAPKAKPQRSPIEDVHRRHFGANAGDRGLIILTGIAPHDEYAVGALMMEDDASKQKRALACGRLAVHGVAAIKAMLATARHEGDEARAATRDELMRTFGSMINGSRYRVAWDLGDATPPRIIAAVVGACVEELRDLKCHTIPQEAIERDAANLLCEVEARHGVTHVSTEAQDPRQGQLF